MRRSQINQSKQPLGNLKTLIVISDWIFFLNTGDKWLYKNQEVQSIHNSSVIFIPVDFSRIIRDNVSHILLYGAGIYWTKFSVSKQTITTDHRFLSGLLVPE